MRLEQIIGLRQVARRELGVDVFTRNRRQLTGITPTDRDIN